MIDPAFEILNQRGTPMFFSDVFANRPTAGIVGRIFISTDTYAFYRDTGSGWDLIGGPGTGTITGSGTIGTLPIWNGTQVIGDSSLLEGASKFTTTKDFQADGYYLSGMTGGSGALYWTSDRVTLANYNATGNVVIEAGGGQNAQTISGTNLSTTFYGNIIRNGGLSTQFLKADGSLDSSTYITTNIYNDNGTLSGNRVVSLNSNYLSFAGGQTYIGSQTASSGLLTINNSSADAHLQVVGANSPSIRIDNAGTGATRRFVMGLATATNNFIQGSTAGDICISTASASPLLFGMWQTTNASEVMRISTANNLIVGSTTDNGNRLQVTGNGNFTGSVSATGLFGYILRGRSSDNFGGIGFYANTGSTRYGYIQSGSTNGGQIVIAGDGGGQLTMDSGGNVFNVGNVGIGVTPSTWSLGKVIQLGSTTSVFNDANGSTYFGNNFNYNSNFLYLTSNFATSYVQQVDGKHVWNIAPSGTAGNPITFTQAMTLNASGFLGIGSSTPNVRLQIVQSSNNDGIRIVSSNATTQNTLQFYHDDTKGVIETTYLGSGAFKPLCLNTQGANVLIGTTTDSGYKLRVNGAIFSDDYIQANNNITAKGTFQGYSGAGVFLSYESYGGRLESYDYTTSQYKSINIAPNGGNVLIGTIIDNGQKFQLSGSIRVNGQTAATAGGSSGQHLIINCDGTTYKIALLNN